MIRVGGTEVRGVWRFTDGTLWVLADSETNVDGFLRTGEFVDQYERVEFDEAAFYGCGHCPAGFLSPHPEAFGCRQCLEGN